MLEQMQSLPPAVYGTRPTTYGERGLVYARHSCGVPLPINTDANILNYNQIIPFYCLLTTILFRMSHKALVFTGPAVPFELVDRPTPKPGPNQILIKNITVALNPIDYVIHHLGLWVDHYGYPALAGVDGAGEVAAIGDSVEGLNIGDKVYVCVCFTTEEDY